MSRIIKLSQTDIDQLKADFEKAISDTRKQENLHGPYSSAQEAVASMLED